jgi:magnesium transporter
VKKPKLKLMRKMKKKVSQAPGTLIHMGEKKTAHPTIQVIRYNKNIIEEETMESVDEHITKKGFKGVCWTNINGIHEPSVIEQIGENFQLHSLVQEDILNTYQRPKLDVLDNYLFLVLKMITYDREADALMIENLSFIHGADYVITFQEQVGDVFNAVRQRLLKNRGRIRKQAADYLLYSLVDAVVDHYYLVLETLGDKIEDLEDRLLEKNEPAQLEEIHKLRREAMFLKRAVWPLREVVKEMMKNDTGMFKTSTGIYLRDLYDHTVEVIEITETYRDMISGLQDLYLSGVSNKMNQVMKVLTIIATIFIPLTFIAGIYGMNFEFMPELKWKFGYFIVWGIMLVMGLFMVILFKRKKWL